MPKTQLFELELRITKEYIDDELLKNYDSDTDYDFDSKDIIKPGMTFTMNYTQTKNYSWKYQKINFVLEPASTQVTVVSIRTVIEEHDDIYILGCVLKTEQPIYICISSAFYGKNITLHNDNMTIASGGVKKLLDYSPKTNN